MNIQQVIVEKPYCKIGIMGLSGCGKTYLASSLEFPQVQKIYYFDVVGAISKFYEKAGEDVAILDVGRTLPNESGLSNKLNEIQQRKVIINCSLLLSSDMVKLADYIADHILFNKKESTCALIVDEVGEILSQDYRAYSQRMESLVRIGRNHGCLFTVLITQRIQKVSKNAFGLSDYYISFCQRHPLDLNATYDLVGRPQGWSVLETKIKSLEIGDYLLTDTITFEWHQRNPSGQLKLNPEAQPKADDEKPRSTGARTVRLNQEEKQNILELWKKKYSVRQIEKRTGRSIPTIRKVIADEGK